MRILIKIIVSIVFILTALIVFITIKIFLMSASNKNIDQPTFIKDPITKCQYITANGAMYPRLDDKRKHICSDEIKYTFNPEA